MQKLLTKMSGSNCYNVCCRPVLVSKVIIRDVSHIATVLLHQFPPGRLM